MAWKTGQAVSGHSGPLLFACTSRIHLQLKILQFWVSISARQLVPPGANTRAMAMEAVGARTAVMDMVGDGAEAVEAGPEAVGGGARSGTKMQIG